MKYIKKYEEIKTEIKLDKVFSDCEIFINDLKKCEKHSFLVRGFGRHQDKRFNIKKFTLDTTDRTPLDTPTQIHDKLNYLFDKKFGWYVRNGLFSFGGNDDIYIETDYDYGSETYLLFPIGDYDIVWSDQVNDLFYELDAENLTIPDEYIAEEEYYDKYDEYGDKHIGQYIFDNTSTNINNKSDAAQYISDNYEDFGIDWDKDDYVDEEDFKDYVKDYAYDELIWEPDLDWDEFWDEYQEYWGDKIEEELKTFIKWYKSGDLKNAINSRNEVCMNCEDYYLINQKHIKEISKYIWDE